MSLCTLCGREFPDDVGFCPYCKVPLTKRPRSFVARTIGGPGGFKYSEVPEYVSRKTQAILLVLFGVLLAFVGAPLATFGILRSGEPSIDALTVGLFLFLVGLVLAIYGAHLWNKITHIMWTRQALREYGVPSLFVKPPIESDRNLAELAADRTQLVRTGS